MTVPRRLRYEVLRRDKNTCRYCGASAPHVKLHVDHVIPVALGGSDEPTNLVTACEDCNSGKTSTAPDQHVIDDVSELALRYAAAMKQAHEIRSREWAAAAEAIEQFKAAWDRWTVTETEQHIPLDDDWAISIERWLALGLTADDLTHFVPFAMKSQASVPDKWRYYCGCVWRELDKRRDIAFSLMEQPVPSMPAPLEAEPDDWPPFDDIEQDDMELDGMYVETPILDDLPTEPFDEWVNRVALRACGICQAINPETNCGQENCFLPVGVRSGA